MAVETETGRVDDKIELDETDVTPPSADPVVVSVVSAEVTGV